MKLYLSVFAVAAVLATGSSAFAAGRGTAVGTAYALGATASPAFAGSRAAPSVSRRYTIPTATGSVWPRRERERSILRAR